MRHPLETFPPRSRARWFMVLSLALALTYGALVWIDSATWTDAAPGGQSSLQFAGSTERAIEIVESWEAEGVLHRAGMSLGFDYVFMALYGVLLAGGCVWIVRRARAAGRSRLATAGVMAAWVGLAAAGFDGVEGALLLPIVGDPTSGSPELVRLVASLKYVCIFAAVGFTAIGGSLTRDRGTTAHP